MIFSHPALLAINIAANPKEPQPKAAKLDPGRGLSRLMTAPAPVTVFLSVARQ